MITTIFQISIQTKRIQDDDGEFYQSTLRFTPDEKNNSYTGKYMKTIGGSEKSALVKFTEEYNKYSFVLEAALSDG